jgi:hypothetical protein
MDEENEDFERDPKLWQTGSDPMSDAQRIELEVLSNQASEPFTDGPLTKAEASEKIEYLREKIGVTDEADDTDTVLGDDE